MESRGGKKKEERRRKETRSAMESCDLSWDHVSITWNQDPALWLFFRSSFSWLLFEIKCFNNVDSSLWERLDNFSGNLSKYIPSPNIFQPLQRGNSYASFAPRTYAHLSCNVRNTCIHERSHVVELTFDGPCNNRHASKGGSGTRSLSHRENFTTLGTCSKLVSTDTSDTKIHSLAVTGFVICLVAWDNCFSRHAVWWNLKETDALFYWK